MRLASELTTPHKLCAFANYLVKMLVNWLARMVTVKRIYLK